MHPTDGWRYLWCNGRQEHVEQIGLAIHKGTDLGFEDQGQTSNRTGIPTILLTGRNHADQ